MRRRGGVSRAAPPPPLSVQMADEGFSLNAAEKGAQSSPGLEVFLPVLSLPNNITGCMDEGIIRIMSKSCGSINQNVCSKPPALLQDLRDEFAKFLFGGPCPELWLILAAATPLPRLMKGAVRPPPLLFLRSNDEAATVPP